MNDLNKEKVFENATNFFNSIKERKKSTTKEELNTIYEGAAKLIKKFSITKQYKALDKLLFVIDTIEKEKKLIDFGINTYLYRSDVEYYIDKISDKAVKIIELENYQREIPDELVALISKTDNIFDQFYVLFTDYSDMHDQDAKERRIEKDPILLGSIQKTSEFSQTLEMSERMYFLGDWVDEYCDLTLDKMLKEYSKEHSNPKNIINIPKSINDIREEMKNIKRVRGKYMRMNNNE